MNNTLLTAVLLFCSGCTAAYTHATDTTESIELVMERGTIVEITNRYGTLVVESKDDLIRSYMWGGKTSEIKLKPRKSRWYGSLGAYSPGDTSFSSHDGISRIVAEEGQMHFTSEALAIEWLNQPFMKKTYDVSYNRAGLVGYWCKNPEREQLNVGVFQIYINGKKPDALPGANDKIKMTVKP